MDPDVQKLFQMLESVRSTDGINTKRRWESIKGKRRTQNQVNICSWNIDSTLLAEQKQLLVRKTLDNLLPSVVLLQETIWTGEHIFEKMRKSESDEYSVVANNWKCESVENTEVAILYDPTVIEPHHQNDEISTRWSIYVHEIALEYKNANPNVLPDQMSKLKSLPRRTIAFGAKILTDYHNTAHPFIFISLNMFKTMDETVKIYISERLIEKAKDLATFYETPVIVGADWNIIEASRIRSAAAAANQRMELAKVKQQGVIYQVTSQPEYMGAWDSILCITPLKQQTVSNPEWRYENDKDWLPILQELKFSISEQITFLTAYSQHRPHCISLHVPDALGAALTHMNLN